MDNSKCGCLERSAKCASDYRTLNQSVAQSVRVGVAVTLTVGEAKPKPGSAEEDAMHRDSEQPSGQGHVHRIVPTFLT
jgi:hypothetical protein